MTTEKTEGIVLHSLDFRDRQRIIKIFTPHFGLITLIVKGISKKNYHLVSLTTPLTRGEFLFTKGRGEIYLFMEGTCLDMHLPLRADLNSLNVAGKLVQIILSSQLPGKSTPQLYLLLAIYLARLAQFPEKEALLYSFYLKTLRHEGLSPPSSFFTPIEWEAIQSLSFASSFDEIKKILLQEGLKTKIERIFEELIKS
jgi:DNA repair protein RecO (recombination protein O)